MGVYYPARNVTAAQTVANVANADGSGGGPNQAVRPTGSSDNATSPTTAQVFQLNVTGVGSVSATVQPVGSNDGLNWAALGNSFTASGQNTATAAGFSNIPFAYFSAYVTAISGTNASATVLMSA